jgi:hypothetical protein
MLEARVKQLQNQAHRDFSYNESLNASLVPFLGKEAAEKEAAEKSRRPSRRTTMMRKTSRPSHHEPTMTTTPSALSDFLESSIGSSVPFASAICISTRTFYSATSKTSSWKNY